MMWKLQDAKNKFSEVVDAARRFGPQRVTRRGKPAVVIVDADEFDRMKRELHGVTTRDFVTFLLDGPKDDDLATAIDQTRGSWPTHEMFEP